jgi:hypothetical protein
MSTCTASVHYPVPARYTRYVSIFLESIFFLNIPIRDRWTKIDSETRRSLRRGQFPKRIVPNTRPSHGMANIAGFVPQILSAWSNTGADCERLKHSLLERRPPHRRLLDNPTALNRRGRVGQILPACSANALIFAGNMLYNNTFSLPRSGQRNHPFFGSYWHAAP